MVKTIIIQRINPEILPELENQLSSVDKEITYDEGNELGIYVKEYKKGDGLRSGTILIDYTSQIASTKREKSEIISTETLVQSVATAHYTIVNEVSGSGKIDHLFLVTSGSSHNRLVATALNKILGVDPFMRVTFNFTPSNQSQIQNIFDDIVKIRGDDITDQHISGLAVTGNRIFASPEYRKAFTGAIQYLGLRLGKQWFIVNRNGRITIYQSLAEDESVEIVKQIISKLLSVGAVNY